MSSKKDQAKKIADAEAEAKVSREAYFKEAKQYKQRIKPLVNFLRNKKLRFTHAIVGQVRIQYFRLDQFQKLLVDNRNYISQHEQLSKLIKNSSSDFIYYKRPEDIKIKYPKKLEPVLINHPDKKYASFRFDTTESKKGMTIFIVFAVLMLVMFPIWPYELKYAIWLITLILTLLLSAVILLRLVIFLLFSIFNYQVWIFPNLFQTNGFLDGFVPLYEVSKGDKSWFNIFIRLFAISSFMLLALHVYLNPTFIDENIQFTKSTINDMHDWGVEKITNKGNFSQRAITNLEVILNETADVQVEVIPNQTVDVQVQQNTQFFDDASKENEHQL